MDKKEFWFIVGSQELYGPQVLKTVEKRAKEMAQFISKKTCFPLVFKTIVKSNEDCLKAIKAANYDDNCLGIVTWCHTFSPSKMWINGLKLLQKPWCHFASQYHKDIPNKEIDMDFMNLNQAAHGDREHGFIGARLRLARKIIVGHYQDNDATASLDKWMRAAYGYTISQGLNVIRFGDNMRNVAVTEGDKIEAQKVFGWQVNTVAVNDLVDEMNHLTTKEIDSLMNQYKTLYSLKSKAFRNVRYQAQEELAIAKLLHKYNAIAYTNTFEDLCNLRQLPGLATQHLMFTGIGYGGEGDWKTAAMTAIIKAMTKGLKGGTSFMEDYSYNLAKSNEWQLGAHMLEVCPSLAASKPEIHTHKLTIGKNPDDPARLIFNGKAGKGVVVSIVDLGGRFRMIVQDIQTIKPPLTMPNLPVARVAWKAAPNLKDGVKMWILAGGSHHTTLSLDIDSEILQDWANMMGIEFVHINKNSTYESLKMQLDLYDKLHR